MADNDFRTTRRDPLARDSDPLAELARLIGQSDPRGGRGRGTGETAQYVDEAAPTTQLDWAAAEEYVQRSHDAEDSYASPRTADESYQGPPQYSPPSAFDDTRARHSREETQEAASAAQSFAYVSPLHAGERSDQGEEYARQASSHASGDEPQDDYEEAPPSRRRAIVVIVALLGVVVVGAAGALGYRAMFGGSLIPSLPPIIKPGNTPVKIVPNKDASGATSQPNAGSKPAGDQLVPHQEKPVDIQAANPVPRVVTTIPVISNTPPVVLPGGEQPAAAQPATQAALPPASNPPAQLGAAPDQLNGPPSAMSPSGSKPVHTVIIKPGQPPAASSAAAADSMPARPPKPRQAASRPPQNTGPVASAGPLSIVPSQDNAAALPPSPRTRTAMTHPSSAPTSPAPTSSAPMSLTSPTTPAEEAPAPRTGGYAVQVSSQRSEAEAQAAYRALQAKYPNQLGSRHAMVRRADLGAKGIYYRALVGPFASSEQAASLCSSLKAAGGSCIIQRN